MDAPLRRVDLDPGILRGVDVDVPADRRHERLLAGGYLTEPGGEPPEPDHPATAIVAIRGRLMELMAAEDRILAIRVHKPFRSGAVQGGVVFAIPASVLLVAKLFLMRAGDTMVDRFFAVVFGFAAGWIGWGFIGLIGLAYVVWFDRKKRRLLDVWGIEEERARRLLIDTVRDLCARSFVARVGRSVVRSRPHLAWAEAARAAVLAELRRRGGSRGVRGPDDDWGRRATALADELKGDIARVGARFEALAAAPPDTWTSDGVEVDFPRLAAEMEALQVRRTEAERSFAGVLSASA